MSDALATGLGFGSSSMLLDRARDLGVPVVWPVSDTMPAFDRRPDDFAINPFHPLARGLVGAWMGALAGGRTVKDSSLYGNHGTWAGTGTSHWTPGQRQTAYGFNGTDDYVVCPHLPAMPFSISLWFYVVDVTNTYTLFSVGDTGLTGDLTIRLNSQGNLAGDPLRILVKNFSASTTSSIVPNKWQHAVATVDTSLLSALLDGGGSGTTAGTFTMDAGSTGTTIGKNNSSSFEFNTSGMIADVLVYDKTLSTPESAQIYKDTRTDPLIGGLLIPR